uniref:Uncharacterized protein n=1 Tax=Glossina palpalis gambiensis TaxID=67801 RepID=A0A1B0B4L5_9MUSC
MLFCGSYGARIQQHDRKPIHNIVLVKLIVAAIKLKHRPLDVPENLNAVNDKKHPHITCLKTKIASGIGDEKHSRVLKRLCSRMILRIIQYERT